MEFTIQIDNLIITADVHAYETSSGYRDLEYTIERVLELDEDNLPFELTMKESDAILSGLENVVKAKLMLEIERENEL
jgi:hypothetical protein